MSFQAGAEFFFYLNQLRANLQPGGSDLRTLAQLLLCCLWEEFCRAGFAKGESGRRLFNRLSGEAVLEVGEGAEETDDLLAAESLDGINWKRPSLGLYEFNGSKDNNIVWTGSGGHNFSPFKDTNPAALPGERYKAVGSGRVGGEPVLLGYVSQDGIQWRQLREEPLLTDGKFDSLNVAFWDSVRNHYVALLSLL